MLSLIVVLFGFVLEPSIGVPETDQQNPGCNNARPCIEWFSHSTFVAGRKSCEHRCEQCEYQSDK